MFFSSTEPDYCDRNVFQTFKLAFLNGFILSLIFGIMIILIYIAGLPEKTVAIVGAITSIFTPFILIYIIYKDVQAISISCKEKGKIEKK